MKVIIVEPNKKARIAEIGKELEDMQEIVGGYIEAVYPSEDEICLVCNEEGKIEGLELNRGLFDDDGELMDIISGTFFICGIGSESFESVPENLIDKYFKMYEYPEMFYRDGDKIISKKIKQ